MNHSFGICMQSYIPLRAEPSERSEQVSQVLFGETFRIIEEYPSSKFCFIKLDFDGYEGWVNTSAIDRLDPEKYLEISGNEGIITHSRFLTLKSESYHSSIVIGAGSNLRLKGNEIEIQDDLYKTDIFTDETHSASELIRDDIIRYAKELLNVSYLWGGRSSFGIDCSGLVQNVFKQAGFLLPRDSRDQAVNGQTLNFITEAKPGDIAFFDNEEGEINHVGIIMEQNKIIHGSGKVKMDNIDHHGIYSSNRKEYSHKLRLIKRILD